jgi:hypothetical protein
MQWIPQTPLFRTATVTVQNLATGEKNVVHTGDDGNIPFHSPARQLPLTQISSPWTLDLRASVAHYNENVSRSRVFGFDDTTLGFSQNFSNSRFVPIPPRISLS